VPWVFPKEPGIPVFADVMSSDGSQLFTLGFAVTWELTPGVDRAFVFLVAESRVGFDAQVAGFRHSLGLWLAGATLVLLTVQGLILAWSLAPLRRLAREVREIETGQRTELTGQYPKELMGLTENLNAMIRNSHVQLKRYRDSLGDLAHSLKTPLAVLHNSVDEGQSEDLGATVREQVTRMNQTVEYQLQRAAASGRTALATPVDVQAVASRLMSSLKKVYSDKSPNLQIDVSREAIFYGDPGDLTEILGNLADNACKWCRRRVEIRGRKVDAHTGQGPKLILEVEDDGPGIPQATRRAVMNRGVRGDVVVSGQGIGLAVVRELVEEVYGGSLEIADGALGGALIRLIL
jgi:two-component system sensor histidine kinase PhoQ